MIIKEGDNVLHIQSNNRGKVITTYPEINTAIVKTDLGTEKAKFTDLVVITTSTDAGNEEAVKKESLLGKLKGPFKRRDYD